MVFYEVLTKKYNKIEVLRCFKTSYQCEFKISNCTSSNLHIIIKYFFNLNKKR